MTTPRFPPTSATVARLVTLAQARNREEQRLVAPDDDESGAYRNAPRPAGQALLEALMALSLETLHQLQVIACVGRDAEEPAVVSARHAGESHSVKLRMLVDPALALDEHLLTGLRLLRAYGIDIDRPSTP